MWITPVHFCELYSVTWIHLLPSADFSGRNLCGSRIIQPTLGINFVTHNIFQYLNLINSQYHVIPQNSSKFYIQQ